MWNEKLSVSCQCLIDTLTVAFAETCPVLFGRRSFNAFGKAMGRSKKSEKFETKVQEMIEESKQKKESADPETPATNKYAELQAECEKLKAKVKDYESYIGLLKERVLFLEENNTLMKEAIVQMCIKQYKEN